MDPTQLPHNFPFDVGMPMWAKLMSYVGFPIVVASSLLWVFTDQLKTERSLLVEHNEIMREHAQVAVQEYKSQLQIGAASLRALSQICANGAKTQADREACAVVVLPQ